MSAVEAVVWVDPGRKFGEPCVFGTRIPTEMVAESVWLNGTDDTLICWPQLTTALIRGACWHEARHGARRYRKAWAGWLDAWHEAMWRSDWQNVPDPPRRTTSEGRPYPACGEHVTRLREAKTTTTEGDPHTWTPDRSCACGVPSTCPATPKTTTEGELP